MKHESAAGPIEVPVRRFSGRDGADLAYREIGSSQPVVLFHGFLADGRQWLDHGHVDTLAAPGHRVILPDLCGHCDSTRSHDPHDYQPDVLTDDGLALIEHLDLHDYALGGYSLGGYSLGARVALRMLVRGAHPARAIIAGQGLTTITDTPSGGTTRRALAALAHGHAIDPGSSGAADAHWITHLGADPHALLHVLDTLCARPPPRSLLSAPPTLVAIGAQDPRTPAPAAWRQRWRTPSS